MQAVFSAIFNTKKISFFYFQFSPNIGILEIALHMTISQYCIKSRMQQTSYASHLHYIYRLLL